MRVAYELLEPVRNAYVIADRAYSARKLVAELEARGCDVVIPSQPTHQMRLFDRHLYKDRHLVENFFQKLKRNRRLAMRYEKLLSRFRAFVVLTSIHIWLF